MHLYGTIFSRKYGIFWYFLFDRLPSFATLTQLFPTCWVLCKCAKAKFKCMCFFKVLAFKQDFVYDYN